MRDFDEPGPSPNKPHDWRIIVIVLLGTLLVVTWAAQNGAYDGAASPFTDPIENPGFYTDPH